MPFYPPAGAARKRISAPSFPRPAVLAIRNVHIVSALLSAAVPGVVAAAAIMRALRSPP